MGPICTCLGSNFPSVLLQKQDALRLDGIDIVIILQIAKHWWHADNAPRPSQVQLAKTMGVDLSTVKRHLAGLKEEGLVTWTQRKNEQAGQLANAYDLTGLVKRLNEFGNEELAARKKAADDRKERRRRKRPALRALAGGKAGSDD